MSSHAAPRLQGTSRLDCAQTSRVRLASLGYKSQLLRFRSPRPPCFAAILHPALYKPTVFEIIQTENLVIKFLSDYLQHHCCRLDMASMGEEADKGFTQLRRIPANMLLVG
jgi:hypothetical protein